MLHRKDELRLKQIHGGILGLIKGTIWTFLKEGLEHYCFVVGHIVSGVLDQRKPNDASFKVFP